MKVSIWANHCSNTFGVPDNLHLTELSAILRDPGPQKITLFDAILNPTAFAIIQIEASNVSATINSRKDDEAAARSSA